MAQIPSTPSDWRQTCPLTVCLAIVAPFAAWINSGLFACTCGHLDRLALPGNGIAALLAWVGLLCTGNRQIAVRLCLDLLTALTTVVLVKNLMDMSWFGHNPVWRAPSPSLQLSIARALVWTALPVLTVAVTYWVLQTRHRVGADL